MYSFCACLLSFAALVLYCAVQFYTVQASVEGATAGGAPTHGWSCSAAPPCTGKALHCIRATVRHACEWPLRTSPAHYSMSTLYVFPCEPIVFNPSIHGSKPRLCALLALGGNPCLPLLAHCRPNTTYPSAIHDCLMIDTSIQTQMQSIFC
jgi:hypothetical protein